MKKFLLSVAVLATAMLSANAADYFLDIPAIYQGILDGEISQATPDAANPPNKYLLQSPVTQGIFAAWSDPNRLMRIDVQTVPVVWTDGTVASTHRLEPNGASNATNGRKIYIDCPAAGTLTVGAWTGSAGRGYTVETAASMGGNSTGTLDATYAANLPLIPSPYEGEPMTPQTFDIPGPMIVVLNPDGGFYYGFIKFVESTPGNFLDIPAIYQGILDGEISQATPDAANPPNKYLLQAPVNQGIFTAWSDPNRLMRIDIQTVPVVWTDGTVASTHRLEPNGASNATNGRKIYIDCPAAGTLTVGAWTGSTGRGYTVETAESMGGNSVGAALDATYAANLPLIASPYEGEPMTPQTFTIPGPMIVVLNPDGGFYYGFIRFETGGTKIPTIDVQKQIRSVEYFDLLGRKVANEKLINTVLIKKTTYTDGTSSSSKIITKAY